MKTAVSRPTLATRFRLCSGFALLALAVMHLLGAQDSPATISKIAVVTSSGVPAYEEALEGLKQGFDEAGNSFMVIDLKNPGEQNGLNEALSGSSILAVSIGSEATQAVGSAGTTPYIPTMVLHSDGAGGGSGSPGRRVGALTLDVSIETVASELRKRFPGKERLAVIRNPNRSRYTVADLRAQAKRSGFSLQIVDCDDPKQLLDAFLQLRGKVDFVYCAPDESLYNSATLKPLVMASLRNRLPIVGFSSGFVRAGAAVSVYPDFREVGYQTAGMVREQLGQHAALGVRSPDKVIVAVNPKVLRILGLRYESSGQDDRSTIVVQ